MSKKDHQICSNYAKWRPDRNGSVYGECMHAFTCKLITPSWHQCGSITTKFKPKEAKDE